MNQQLQDQSQETPDPDSLLGNLAELTQEAVERDLPRIIKLHGLAKLAEPKVLSAELSQTVVPILRDYIALSSQLITEHQQGIVELEDTTYQDMPRAFHILLGALGAKGIVTEGDIKKVVSLIGEGSDRDSLLSRSDADLILGVLMSFKTLATQIASSKEETEAADATKSLEQIDAAVARVMEISEPPEPEEESDDQEGNDEDNEDSESDEDDESAEG